MTILYGRPDDPAEFDRYYREVHLPIAEKMRGLTGWNLTWTDDQTGESPAVGGDVYLVVDLLAESAEAMDAVLASPEGQAASADVPRFATGGVVFLRGTQEQVDL
ncbi:EthD family reductase [Nocardioides sp. CFH 31398]|uniref:EthD family reductase n=1 Tax=Nocardioides sp. CFH 31398 TaxID=2919579 RepID=UPI001F06C024|nr:EthD family reductase [Nocardioides sp. CFH 31398]MCH1868526.1 EthD family reductase [Nocardioides sp. CFH 31398]